MSRNIPIVGRPYIAKNPAGSQYCPKIAPHSAGGINTGMRKPDNINKTPKIVRLRFMGPH
jgi:hypothetical protein